jgi:hypothetical protein
MLILNLNPAPRWVELMTGVRVHLRPMCNAFMLRARMQTEVIAAAEGDDQQGHAIALAKAVFEAAVIEWEGIGDEAGAVIGPSPAAISALLDHYAPYEAFCAEYFHPWLVVDAEKNGSAPSLNGTSAVAQTIAVPAIPSAKPAQGLKKPRTA